MLAKDVMALNQRAAELDKLIEVRFRDHQHFEVITSMPGPGIIPGAEFLTATGGFPMLMSSRLRDGGVTW